MKKLIIINGTIGVGKSTVCKELLGRTEKSVWLDGDWCWMLNPFTVNEYNKKMVMENITYMLNNFIKNPDIENIIFCWVIHLEEIFEEILKNLNTQNLEIIKITLTCSKSELNKRMTVDKRDFSVIEKSIKRLNNYENMSTNKIDTTDMPVDLVVSEISEIII